MTVIEKLGNLTLILTAGGGTRRKPVRNIRSTASGQNLFDIGSAIAALLNDPLSDIRRVSSKSYTA